MEINEAHQVFDCIGCNGDVFIPRPFFLPGVKTPTQKSLIQQNKIEFNILIIYNGVIYPS